MKKFVSSLMLILLAAVAVTAQAKPHAIIFYNVENLFDTQDDPKTRDEDYTPEGKYNWTEAKYQHKLSQIERVLFDIAVRKRDFPTVIGLSEIENRKVVEDVAATPKLKGANYRVVHFDSPDRRGIDVAMMYRPDIFKVDGSKAERSTIVTESGKTLYTRDILTMWGRIEGQPFFFATIHWPSRWGGAEQSSYLREAAGKQTRRIIDSVRRIRPESRFVVMGDFNDDPIDKSMEVELGAKGSIKDMGDGDLFNPYHSMYKAGYGTLAYGDAWNVFDNIIVSRNLVDGKKGTLQIQKSESNKKYYGNILKMPYMIQESGKFKGYPFRSFSGGAYASGFSDHLPVFIHLD